MSGGMQFCQIDSCRLGGVNENIAVMLMAEKLNSELNTFDCSFIVCISFCFERYTILDRRYCNTLLLYISKRFNLRRSWAYKYKIFNCYGGNKFLSLLYCQCQSWKQLNWCFMLCFSSCKSSCWRSWSVWDGYASVHVLLLLRHQIYGEQVTIDIYW